MDVRGAKKMQRFVPVGATRVRVYLCNNTSALMEIGNERDFILSPVSFCDRARRANKHEPTTPPQAKQPPNTATTLNNNNNNKARADAEKRFMSLTSSSQLADRMAYVIPTRATKNGA